MKIKHILLALAATLTLGSFAADKLVTSHDDGSVIERYVDQSDGTWARKVATTSTTATAVGTPATTATTVQGVGFRSAPTVTRPANTTTYTINDVVGGAIEFTNIGPSGGHVIITNVDLAIYVSAIPTGMTSFRLHLYDVTPPSALADNAAWDLPSGDRASYLGYVDMGSPADVGSTLFVQATQINQQFKLATGSTSLFGYLVTNGGFAPAANSEVYMPRLRAVGI